MAGSSVRISMQVLGILKSMPFMFENYMSFDRQLLTWYWAIIEKKCYTMGHQMIMNPELPIISQILLDLPNQEVMLAQ